MKQRDLPHLAAQLYDTPLAATLSLATRTEQTFRQLLAGEDLPKPEAARGGGAGRDKPYRVTSGGVAILPVMGTLMQRADFWSCGSSYQSLTSLLTSALADAEVRGILLEIDSGGGAVAGLFDWCDKIVAARQSKPVWAHANESAYSAAYATACSAEKLFVAQTGGVGSIGVIAMHVDQSARNAASGLTYTPIHAGSKKNDLSPHAPISDRARADMQAKVDSLYDIFVDRVAAGRRLDPAAIRATEAGLLSAPEALQAGFVDGICSLDAAISQFEAAIAASSFSKNLPPKDKKMSTPESELATQMAAARADGLKAGAVDERKRIAAILDSDDAKGRQTLARKMALESDLSPDQAISLLKSAAVESVAGAGSNPLVEAMSQFKNPDVGPGADQDVAPSGAAPKKSLLLEAVERAKQCQ